MKPIEELLQNLARPEVLEFGLVTNRLPSVNVGGRFEPVDDEAPTTDRVLEMLVTMGGSRYVEALSDKPVQWTTRLDGVGVIAVAAILRRDVVQARFTVARREGSSRARPSVGPSPAALPSTPPFPSVPSAPLQRPSSRMSVVPTGVRSVPPPVPPLPPAPSSAAILAHAPTTEEWDDDDEPTVQTASPPIAPPPLPADEPRPKPARRPEEVAKEAAAASGGVARDTARELGQFVPEVIEAKDTGEAEGEDEVIESRPPPRASQPVRSAEAASAVAVSPAAAVPPPPAPAKPPPPAKTASSPKVLAPPPREPAEGAVASSRGPRRRPTPTSVDKVAPESSPSVVAAPVADRPRPPTSSDLDGTDHTVEFHKAGPASGPPIAKSVVDAATREVRIDSLDALLGLVATAAGPATPDVHVVANRPVTARVAGDLVPRSPPVAAALVDRLASELLGAAARAKLDAEGAADALFEHGERGRFRVRATKAHAGIRLLLRHVLRAPAGLTALGIPEPVSSLARAPRGLVLVAAPLGHGKTTTMSALVHGLEPELPRRIVVVESRPELAPARAQGLVTHHVVGEDVASVEAGATLAARLDADVVVLDGALSPGAVRAAVELAEAGKLVLLAVACPGAARAVDRVLDGFAAAARVSIAERLARVLRGVVGQRLVAAEGRTRTFAAFELVPSSLALYAAVREGRPGAVAALLGRGRQPGGVKLEDSLGDLVRSQKIPLDVARGHADHPGDVEAPVAAVAARKG